MPRHYSLLLVMGLLTTACATQTPYRPAEKRGQEGYTETQLTSNRYRISVVGNSVTPADTVRDYALLRAAELTLQTGNDWFQIANNNADKKVRASTIGGGGIDFPGTTSVYQRCGLLRCNTAVVSSPGFSSGVDIATTTTSTEYSSSIEIVMGKNPMPSAVESYDARELASTLRRYISPPQ